MWCIESALKLDVSEADATIRHAQSIYAFLTREPDWVKSTLSDYELCEDVFLGKDELDKFNANAARDLVSLSEEDQPFHDILREIEYQAKQGKESVWLFYLSDQNLFRLRQRGFDVQIDEGLNEYGSKYERWLVEW